MMLKTMIKVNITFILEFRLLSYSKIPKGYENMTQNLHCEHPPLLAPRNWLSDSVFGESNVHLENLCLVYGGVTLRERKTT